MMGPIWLLVWLAPPPGRPQLTPSLCPLPCSPPSLQVPGDLTKESADRIVAHLSQNDRPTLVTCATGRRAGAAVVLYIALQNKWTAEQALQL